MGFNAFSMPQWNADNSNMENNNSSDKTASQRPKNRQIQSSENLSDIPADTVSSRNLNDIFSMATTDDNSIHTIDDDDFDPLTEVQNLVQSYKNESAGEPENVPHTPANHREEKNVPQISQSQTSNQPATQNTKHQRNNQTRQKQPSPQPAQEHNISPQQQPEAEVKNVDVRTRGLARDGRTYTMPNQQQNSDPIKPQFDWDNNANNIVFAAPPDEIDYHDLLEVNRDLVKAKSRCFTASHYLKQAQRELVEAKTSYKRALRRELLQISGGTAEIRKAAAEIRCEQQEFDVDIAEQKVEEFKKLTLDCRDDLKALENISHNVRTQMNVFEK